MCGLRQLFYFQGGAETTKGWTLLQTSARGRLRVAIKIVLLFFRTLQWVSLRFSFSHLCNSA